MGNASKKNQSGSMGFKDIFVIFFMIIGFSLLAFTGGLLVGRQLTLEEMKHDGASHGESAEASDEHGSAPDAHEAKGESSEHQGDEAAHGVEVKHEVHEEAVKEATVDPHATPAHGEEHAAVEDKHIEKEHEDVEPAKPEEFAAVEAKKMAEAKSAPRKDSRTTVPEEVSSLFEGGGPRKPAAAAPAKHGEDKKSSPADAGLKGDWTLQVGAYPTEQEANSRVHELKAKGVSTAYLEETPVKDKGTWYRVGIGQFPSPKEAQDMGNKLKTNGVIGNFFARKADKKK